MKKLKNIVSILCMSLALCASEQDEFIVLNPPTACGRITNHTSESFTINLFEEIKIINMTPVFLRWLCEPNLALVAPAEGIKCGRLAVSATAKIPPFTTYIKLSTRDYSLTMPINSQDAYSIIETSDNDEPFRLIHDNDEDIK